VPLSIHEIYKKDTKTGKGEERKKKKKHQKNLKTGGNPDTPTKLAHKTQRLKHHIRGTLALPRLEPKLLTS
jgi:hypothetical protein